jgi:hypothetical protein
MVEAGYANDERVKRFKRQTYERFDFIVPRVVADKAAQNRLEALEQRALEYTNSGGEIIDGELVPDQEPDWFGNK